MILTKTAIATLALLVIAAAAPASARSRAGHPGYDARAQATGDGNDMSVGAGRAKALQECNQEASKFLEYTWGDAESDHYRACMAGRGQPE